MVAERMWRYSPTDQTQDIRSQWEAKRNHSLYAVDERISDRLACLIEPFTVGCRAARRGQPKPGEHAVVFGCGTIGIAAAISLKYFGVSKVMICCLQYEPSDSWICFI